MTEPDVLTEVPEALKRLARCIIRGFYGPQHALVVDMLVRNPCIKEDDLLELLKFERKQLRSIISTLKSDKLIKVRMRVETDAEGRTTRHNYYFVSYNVFVNVVKYKLDHMRRKIETEERDSTSRASFKCPQCHKTFTDLEANELIDMLTGTFRCTYCHTEVEEEASSLPQKDARLLMARFNEQIEPLYTLLREVEDIKLAPNLIAPEPLDLKLKSNERSNKGASGPDRPNWSNREGGYGVAENTVTIAMEGDEETVATETKPAKEQPIWMRESTVEGVMTDSMDQVDSLIMPGTSADSQPSGNQDDIMATLLAHEKKGGPVAAMTAPKIPGSDEESSTSESEDEASRPVVAAAALAVAEPEMMDSDEEDTPLVTIGNLRVPYHDVTEELVNQMTANEKEAYIQLGQEMYQDMYD